MKLAKIYNSCINCDDSKYQCSGVRYSRLQGAFEVMLLIIVGTSVGLVVKYILNKRYLFRFHARNVMRESETFVLYVLMGLTPTVVCWGFRFDFHPLFKTKEMRYLGGVISLASGYLTHYYLAKRFVFRVEEI